MSPQNENDQQAAKADIANVPFGLGKFNNMSSLQFDEYAYSLNYTQTGCYRKGALPVALAKNDTCLLGWYCK